MKKERIQQILSILNILFLVLVVATIATYFLSKEDHRLFFALGFTTIGFRLIYYALRAFNR